MGILLFIFWPVLAAFIPGGLLANRKVAFASIFIVVLLALVTYERLTNPLVVNRASAVGVSWGEVAVGVLLGWAITRRIDRAKN